MGERQSSVVGPFALYPLRAGLALVFLYTGVEKLIDPQANALIVASVGLPWPTVSTILIGAVEILGAIAFLTGVMTRTAATLLSIMMVIILATLKIPGSFWGDGWGIDVAVLAGTLTLAFNGPGRPTVATALGLHEIDPEVRFYRYLADRLGL